MVFFENININYNLRSQMDFMQTSVSSSNFGTKLLGYLVTKEWDIVPYDTKSIKNLELFKKLKRKW